MRPMRTIFLALMLNYVCVIPAEHKDGRAPFVEELESPVVNGGGVDLKEVLEDGEAGSGNTGQGGHLSVFQCFKALLFSLEKGHSPRHYTLHRVPA